ncbi:hypothetical protein AB3S75_002900 [Citrus x aurantiifolia]
MESGYKFQPSDELILRLLKEKRLNPHFSHHPIKDIDHICSLEPWDLPKSKTESEDLFTFSMNLVTSTGTVTGSTEEQKQGNGKLPVKIPKSKLETALPVPKSS